MKNITLIIWILIVMMLFGVIYFIGIYNKSFPNELEAISVGKKIVEKLSNINIEKELDEIFVSSVKEELLKNEYISYNDRKLDINIIDSNNLISYDVEIINIERKMISYNLFLNYKEENSDEKYIEIIEFHVIKDNKNWKINYFNQK